MAITAFASLNQVLKSASIYGLLQVGIWCVIIVSILWSFKKRYATKTSGLPVPRIKTRIFSIYGHMNTFPPASVRKKFALPISAFLIQTISGHSKIFENDKLFGFDIGFQRFVILRKPEVVEKVMKSNILIEKGWMYDFLKPWLGTGLLTSGSSKWRSRRKLLTPSFHFDILKDFLPIIDEQSRILVDVLKKKADEEWVDAVPLITLCSLDIICASTLGINIEAQRNSNSEYVQAVLRASHTIMDRMCTPHLWVDPIFRISAIGRQFYKDINTLHSFTNKVIKQKTAAFEQQQNGVMEVSDIYCSERKKKRQALMDLLVEHRVKHQDISEEDIREEVDTFTFEGHDTTSMGMSWALYLLGLYPEVQAKLHEEMDAIFGDDTERCVTEDDLRDMRYLDCVLKESQRIFPSVPLFGRQVEKDQDLCGFKVKKGDILTVLSYLLHRESEAFPDEEKFDPDRFLPENSVGRHPFAYIPFSAGPRNCIGQRFAQMEEKVVVANVLRNFSVKSLNHRDTLILSSQLILRATDPLRLKFTPRASATTAAY